MFQINKIINLMLILFLLLVKNNQNIDKLINLVKVKLSKKFISNNSALITRERHRVKLNDCCRNQQVP